MGYTTEFEGKFEVSPPLTADQVAYLKAFSGTRRMKRNAKAAQLDDPLRLAVNMPIGEDGAYFVGGSGFKGQKDDASVIDHDEPPAGQPGLWCDWVPTDDGKFLEHNGSEKSYYWEQWLDYLIDHFLQPWSRTLSGEVSWQGEQGDDRGVIRIRDGYDTQYCLAVSRSCIDAIDSVPDEWPHAKQIRELVESELMDCDELLALAFEFIDNRLLRSDFANWLRSKVLADC